MIQYGVAALLTRNYCENKFYKSLNNGNWLRAMAVSDEFEVLPAGEMREKYGLNAKSAPPIVLNRNRVPKPLWQLIPLAEEWGISDDLIRADFVDQAGPARLRDMQAAIGPYESALDDWLAGPEAELPELSPEYIAFTCLRMAADGI